MLLFRPKAVVKLPVFALVLLPLGLVVGARMISTALSEGTNVWYSMISPGVLVLLALANAVFGTAILRRVGDRVRWWSLLDRGEGAADEMYLLRRVITSGRSRVIELTLEPDDAFMMNFDYSPENTERVDRLAERLGLRLEREHD